MSDEGSMRELVMAIADQVHKQLLKDYGMEDWNLDLSSEQDWAPLVERFIAGVRPRTVK